MAPQRYDRDLVWPSPPAGDKVIEVGPGALWAWLHLPFRLNHVNVWLLEKEGAWTVIDTGCATPLLFAAWEGLLAGPMRGWPVRRVVATHSHVDHIGLSGWLVTCFGVAFVGTFGEWMWQVIVTRSHTHKHAAFLDADREMLIAVDHLLATTSPVIAVYEMVVRGDPRGDYLGSFVQFAALPEATLVLPSHGLPYRGIHRRIAALQEHHRERLQATSGFLNEPRTGMALSRLLFPRVKNPEDLSFVLGKTLAHVNCLLHQGAVEELADAQGRLTYRTHQSDSRSGQAAA